MERKIEPYLMAVLSSRINAITIEMINTVLRTARSQVLSVARDFSTALLDQNGNVIAAPLGIPVHCANMGLMAEHLFNHPDGIKEGDVFLNNSPYHGNTHPADYTYIAPIFVDGDLMFFSLVRAHQADCGNSIPTTYYAKAKDVYQEGALIFPSVKIQKNHHDVPDIINIAKSRIRVPRIWYGDYLAAIGALRISERQVIKMCTEYGNQVIRDFCEAYHEYAEKRILHEIKKMHTHKAVYEFIFDGIKGVKEDVIIHLEAEVEKESGDLVIDVTKNIDEVDWALNLSEATTLAACRSGVLTHLEDIPRIEGAMKHIKVNVRENCILGKCKHPRSYSAATTNLYDRTMSAVGVLINQLIPGSGIAETNTNLAPSLACISGLDWRKNDEPFMNQILFGSTGGPAVKGYDGWVTFLDAGVGGCARWNTVELLEQQYPIMVTEIEVLPDAIGSGEWDSAPACKTVMTAIKSPVTFAIACDGTKNPPKGAKGGLDGPLNKAWKYNIDEGEKSRVELDPYGETVITNRERFVSECSSGGGYGNPLDRDPELVRHRIREGWITEEYGKGIYGVVIDTSTHEYSVNYEETNRLRKKLKEAMEKGVTTKNG